MGNNEETLQRLFVRLKQTLFQPEIAIYLFNFLKNPFQSIKTLPDWNWQILILTQILITSGTGALGGIFVSPLAFLGGLFIVPILTLITVSITTLFFYYVIQIFYKKTYSFRQMFTLVFLANVPFFIFQILSPIVPIISLFGLAISGVLIGIGFMEHLQLEKKFVTRLIAGLFILFSLIWLWGHLDSSKIEKTFKSKKYQAPEVKLGQ